MIERLVLRRPVAIRDGNTLGGTVLKGMKGGIEGKKLILCIGLILH